ncbi:MAG: YceI family protein [Candidatus Xenobia bacterium]
MQIWEIDAAHSGVHFSVKHMVISKVRGRFGKLTGTISVEEDDRKRAQVHVDIDTASVDTGEAQRDGHLRSADFLDAERYPTITFESLRVEDVDRDNFRLIGNLTLHGVTREVALEVEAGGRGRDPWGGERAGFTAKTYINRKDFGLAWNQVLETGGVLVGERIDIELEVELLRKVEAGVK